MINRWIRSGTVVSAKNYLQKKLVFIGSCEKVVELVQLRKALEANGLWQLGSFGNLKRIVFL